MFENGQIGLNPAFVLAALYLPCSGIYSDYLPIFVGRV